LFPMPANMIWKDLDVQERSPESDLDMFERLLALMSSDSTPQEKIPTIFEAFLSQGEQRIRPGVNSLREMIIQARERMESESRNIQATFSSQQQKVHTIDGRTARNALDTDRIVSTSTTTERTTHEDGTVETCVTVWKQFGDGRETTTTTHTEDPARDDNGQTSMIREVAKEKSGQEIKGQDEKKSEKKGWFWN